MFLNLTESCNMVFTNTWQHRVDSPFWFEERVRSMCSRSQIANRKRIEIAEPNRRNSPNSLFCAAQIADPNHAICDLNFCSKSPLESQRQLSTMNFWRWLTVSNRASWSTYYAMTLKCVYTTCGVAQWHSLRWGSNWVQMAKMGEAKTWNSTAEILNRVTPWTKSTHLLFWHFLAWQSTCGSAPESPGDGFSKGGKWRRSEVLAALTLTHRNPHTYICVYMYTGCCVRIGARKIFAPKCFERCIVHPGRRSRTGSTSLCSGYPSR